MECLPYSPEWLTSLVDLVNLHSALVPPAFTFTAEQVATIVAYNALWAHHYPETEGAYIPEVFCARDQGQLVAAGQWSYPAELQTEESIDETATGHIDWIVAKPGQLPALHNLLEKLTAQAQSTGCQYLNMTTRSSLGVGWFGIPTTWPHIIAGFQHSGFACSDRWLIMTASTQVLEIPQPASIPGIHLAWQENTAALEWSLSAYDEKDLVGECEAWGIPPHFRDCPDYPHWITIEWLGIEKPYRRQGLGRWFLARQLRRQAERGISHAIAWTEVDNIAAQAVNAALGFRSGPECWQFTKKL
ncbi:MAG: GNAT family N-acetyltransferase [Chloroflexi bacterium]|nr:GNAT family N-acetyltransferase [Chloroflexota bacterium]